MNSVFYDENIISKETNSKLQKLYKN